LIRTSVSEIGIPMRACIRCVSYHGDDVAHCPVDGTATWRVERFSPAFGRRLGKDYVILEELARGGTATVHHAVRESKGLRVALKILPTHPEDDGIEARRFLRSAELAGSLTDPHSVKVLDWNQDDDGTCWMAMELLEGRTLHEAVVAGEAPMPPRRAVRIATQVLQALQEVHGAGLVHRDVKPDNVLLLREGDGEDPVKLLDFGLARPSFLDENARLTLRGTTMGTPAYMSPEQGHGRQLDARSDLYSVGVLLFELLSGRLPHDDPAALRVLLKKVAGPAPRVRELAPEVRIPDALEDLVADLLAIEPGRRPATATEVIRRLAEACAAGEAAGICEEAPPLRAPIASHRRVTQSLRRLPPTEADDAGMSAPSMPSARLSSFRMVRFAAEMETGIEELDRQHRDLFDLADAALGGPGPGTTPTAIEEALDRLAEHAGSHFLDEEAWMEQSSYPAIEDHRQGHRRFAADFARMLGEARRTPSIDSMRTALRLAMTLLVRHVRIDDGAFARFMQERARAGTA